MTQAKLSPARLVALRVLIRVWDEGAFAHESLTTVLKEFYLTDLERSEATSLAYGAIAHSSTLDYILNHFLTKPGGVKSRVRAALKLSIFELYFTPAKDYAVVSQGVELVKELHSYSAGIANGVLRNALKEREGFPWDDSLSNLEREALLNGFPFWVSEKFSKEFGEAKAIEIMQASSLPAPLYGFVPADAAAKLDKSGLNFTNVDAEMMPATVRFSEPAAAVNNSLIFNREVLIADAVAQFVAGLYVSNASTSTPAPYSAMEIGSGRGTKTSIAAYLLRSQGASPQHTKLYAIDSHEFKTSITRDYAEAHGLSEILPHTVDATNGGALNEAINGEKVDSLLIDAPCTGLGTLRRHPDKRAKLMVEDIAELAQLSTNLLMAGATVVKPGGQIIYATCTMTSEENSQVVTAFLESPQGKCWHVAPFTHSDVPADWKDFITEEGYFQSYPKADGPDGHFIARLIMTGETC